MRRYPYLAACDPATDVCDVTDQYTAAHGATGSGNTVSSDEVFSTYQSLLAQQKTVQQYAPQLSSQWGWLAKQGQLITSGQNASLSWDQFVQQAENLLQASSAAAAGAGIQQGYNPPPAPPPASCAIWDLSCQANKYMPWIIGAVVLAIAVPAVIGAFRK